MGMNDLGTKSHARDVAVADAAAMTASLAANQKKASPALGAEAINAAISANLASTTDITGLAEFNERAGLQRRRDHHSEALRLQHRDLRSAPRMMPVPRRQVPRSVQKSSSAGSYQDVDHLHAAGMDVVDALRRGDKAEMEETLAADYDALERHTLLRQARTQVDDTALSEEEKEKLKSTLNEMISNLMDTHGDVIRAGLKDAQRFETALDEMDSLSKAGNDNYNPDSLQELRNLYGAKREGKLDAPLTPMALARSLQEKFGVDNFLRALGDVRTKMSADLRSNPPRDVGPRLWLSLQDAAAFNAVQSSVAIGGELRRDLSERVGVTLKTNQATTAVALLGVAEYGVTRGDAFVAHLIDVGNLNLHGLKRIQLYMLIRHAVEKMPVTVWRSEMLSQRMTLLDELRKLAFSASDEEPFAASDADELEEHLRGKVQRKSKRDKGDSESGQHPEQGRDEKNEGEQEDRVLEE